MASSSRPPPPCASLFRRPAEDSSAAANCQSPPRTQPTSPPRIGLDWIPFQFHPRGKTKRTPSIPPVIIRSSKQQIHRRAGAGDLIPSHPLPLRLALSPAPIRFHAPQQNRISPAPARACDSRRRSRRQCAPTWISTTTTQPGRLRRRFYMLMVTIAVCMHHIISDRISLGIPIITIIHPQMTVLPPMLHGTEMAG